MITNTPAAKEEPFTFVRPKLPAPPATTGAELEANRDTLLPAAQAHTAAEEILQTATDKSEQLGKDSNLSAQGRRAAFTEQVVKPALVKLREHEAALDRAEAVIKAEAEQIQQAAVGPIQSPPDGLRAERSAIAAAYGNASEHVKRQALERAMLGKDPALADALAYSHPMLSGLTENTIELLRTDLEGARIDPVAAERVKDKAMKAGTVRRALTATIDALERAADRAQLKEAGVATLRRSDLTDEQKRNFIDTRGLAAFKALPA